MIQASVTMLAMLDSINWIHLTDLHLGLDSQSWLWPRMKHELFKDVERISKGVGPLDLVFFTGDLTQRGSKEEFESLDELLRELWEIFEKSGRTPLLCPIPGNHDLIRPDPSTAIARALTQHWWTDEDVRTQFWRDPACEYRIAVERYFENYTDWLHKTSLPKIDMLHGSLPGDFSATFSKGPLQLGIIGLNSTFLQVSKGDFKRRLDLHVSQLNAVCKRDPTGWCLERTASVLLTHQPPDWLAPIALGHFRQEIYPPGRFLAQFCGHQHAAAAFELGEAGGTPRRLRQAPSLFGLEQWEATEPKTRSHGYNAGQFLFEKSDVLEKLWPRIAVKGHDGSLRLRPDQAYNLVEGDCTVTRFELESAETSPPPHESGSPAAKTDDFSLSTTGSGIPLAQLLDGVPDEQTARASLTACPRFVPSFGEQHRSIRLDEQTQFEQQINESRCDWLVADWGMGAEEFLSVSLERFRKAEGALEAFHLHCDEASDYDSFEALFPQQFGMPLQRFCAFLVPLKGAFLILDQIQPELCSGANFDRLSRMANAILDYCPESRLVFVSRLRPEGDQFQTIELRALDVPDVRTYLGAHPGAPPEVREPETVERIHEKSDGIPMYLERILKALTVSSLASALEFGMEGGPENAEPDRSTPRALVQAITSLVRSPDKRSSRSLRLLKILSSFPYGESLEALTHYLPTEPFFPDNALQLTELALLDVVPLPETGIRVATAFSGTVEQSTPKILKVRRQVRDYVRTLVSEDEREEILFAGVDHLFGRAWRNGKIKLRALPIEYREYVSSGKGNEFALIRDLILYSRERGDDITARRGLVLGIQYTEHLESKERYRDVAMVAGDLIRLVDRDGFPKEWRELAASYGDGLRMMDKDQEAVKYLNATLEPGPSPLGREDTASVWISLALAEQTLDHVDASVAAAEEAKRYAKPLTAAYLHAESIIAELTLEGVARNKRWAEIEKEARNRHYDEVGDTIALSLAHYAEDQSEKLSQLDKILASDRGGYNKVRAVVEKAGIVEESSGSLQLRGSEISTLSLAYSYLHSQRFHGLFDDCHERLWRVFDSRHEDALLLRLFRNTSFVWRIRGEERKEARYVKLLSKLKVEEGEAAEANASIDIRYFTRRLALVLRAVNPLKRRNTQG